MTRLWTGWPRNQVSNPGGGKGVSPRACRQVLWTNEHPNQWVLKRPSPRGKADRTWSWLLISLPCGSKKCARYTSNPPHMPSRSDINRPPQPCGIHGAPNHTQHYNLLWTFFRLDFTLLTGGSILDPCYDIWAVTTAHSLWAGQSLVQILAGSRYFLLS